MGNRRRYGTFHTLIALAIAFAGPAPALPAPDPAFVRTVREFPAGQPEAWLGNGLLGYRVKPNPFASWKGVAAGFTGDFEGGRFETLAYAPYPFAMDVQHGAAPSLMEAKDKVRVVRQSLDMSCGELTTELEFPADGGTATAEILQFVSRTTPVVAAQRVRLAFPKTAPVKAVASVVFGPGTEVVAGPPPGHEKAVDLMLGLTSRGNRSRCGVAVRVDAGDAALVREAPEPGKPPTARIFRIADAGAATLTLLAATVTSEYHPEPDLEACRLVNWGASLGFDRLREQNRAAWAEIWKSRVRVTGDPKAQAYLDAALFYLFSAAHPSARTGPAPFGTSQSLNYYGHVFWDSDAYLMPALLLFEPEAAREAVRFRLRGLDAARRHAKTYGFRGAMYPWESDSRGYESTPSQVDTGWMEHHVSLSVAMGAWQFQQAHGDDEHLRTCTWPILQGVAEWIESRVERTERGYEIRNIMSPVEGMTVHNSAYVNALAGAVLRAALACAPRAGGTPGRTWAGIADRMFIPRGPAPDGSPAKGDILRMHDGPKDQLADVGLFMLGFPYDLPLDHDLLRRTYAHYAALPAPALSMGHAFVVAGAGFAGDRAGARREFHRVIDELSEPVWGMGTEYTGQKTACFVTTMGAMLQTAAMAFTGARFEPENWTKYDACLPEGWEKIEVERVWLGGRAWRLEATHGRKTTLIPMD